MKFIIRDGFVVKNVTKVEVAQDKFEFRETSNYAGEVIDMDAETASLHTQKLEAKDKAAEAWLASKVIQSPAPAGPQDIALLVAQQVAEQLAKLLGSAAPAAPAASA